MAMSDLLYPIFLFPLRIAELYVSSWIIGGSFGQALCKLSVFLPDISTLVSIQSLVLIAVGRFVAVVLPLRSQLIRTITAINKAVLKSQIRSLFRSKRPVI